MKNLPALLAIAVLALSLGACQTASKKECCMAKAAACPSGK